MKTVMEKKRITIAAIVAALCLLGCVAALGANDKTKVKGIISDRTGESLILNTSDGKVTVVLDDSTKVQHPRGLGIRKKQVTAAVLIPGLKVSVDGTKDDQGRITAKTITFDSNDLETAEMIQAGLHPTAEDVAANQKAIATNQQDIATNQQGIAANKQDIASNQDATTANKAAIEQNIKDIQENTDRFSQLSQYDVKGDVTVNFKTGSSRLSAGDQAKLKQLGQTASQLTGYIIEVKGFADSTGNATMNTRLSEDRAQAVIDYLIQQCGIPIRHVIAPGAYGETHEAASNETSSGRAENRRAEVKVLINKGINGA